MKSSTLSIQPPSDCDCPYELEREIIMDLCSCSAGHYLNGFGGNSHYKDEHWCTDCAWAQYMIDLQLRVKELESRLAEKESK